MADGELLEDVLGAWLESRERGEATDAAALLRAHPELAETLPRQLRALDLLDQVLGAADSPGYGMPSRLGPYRIEEEIGAGGMGTVFRATVEETTSGLPAGTTVAAKVVHPHVLRTRGFFPRFHLEAALGRTVEHPNVVKTHGFDVEVVDDIPLCYLVMEYVEGQTLRALLDDLGSVGEPLVRAVGQQVALGLSAIHAAGAVHRDVKPENVLITRDNVVKVMDLGVARVDAQTAGLSRTGAFVGSLAYAAPEQFDGSIVDPRCDLHALGLLLYELCTGENPYRADSPVHAMQRIRSLLPRRLVDAAPHVSDLLDDVVHTLLAKSPDDRLSNAVEVAGLLDEGENSDWWRQRRRRCGERARPSRRARMPRETAVHGRDDDLAQLRASFDAASSGEGCVVLVEGEAGIGKSRVVDELCRALDTDGAEYHLLVADIQPGTTGDEALRTALREHLGSTGSASLLTELPLLVPAFDALLEGRQPPDGAVPLTRDSLATCFVHAMRGMAAQWPTILVVEDLHNASEEARALFTNLAYAVPGHRVLLVGTSRPGVPETWRANLLRLDHVRSMPLARLGPRDLAQLLEETFRSRMLAERLAYLIGTKSDGNPFFVLEIVRGLREAGLVVRRDDGSWESTQEIDEIEVPDSVRELIEVRLASLTDDERHVLDVAACCGFEFDPSLVSEAMGEERIPLIRTLAQIERRHRLVRASGWQFTFDHHQVLEVLHQSLPEPLREAYHRALAEALEARHGAAEQDPETLDGALCVQLCEHSLLGGQGDSALRYLDAAQSHLESSHSPAHAVALIEHALATPKLLSGIARARVLLRVADPSRGSLARLGRTTRQVACAEEVVRLAEEADDLDLHSRAANAHGYALCCASRFEEAESGLRRALELARALGNPEHEVAVEANLGVVLQYLGRLTEARLHLERSLAFQRQIGSRHGEAWVLGGLGSLLESEGDLTTARDHLERSIALHHELGDRAGEAVGAANLSIVFKSQGDLAKARELCERHHTLCRDIGYRPGEAIAKLNLGALHGDAGDLEAAREQYEGCLALLRDVGHPRAEAIATGNLGLVFQSQGNLAAAKQKFDRYLALSREMKYPLGEASASAGLGNVLSCLGDLAAAQEFLERSLALSREIGNPNREGLALLSLGELADELGDTALAMSRMQASLVLRRKIGFGHGVAISLLVLGDLARRTGNAEAARLALTEAMELSREHGHVGRTAFARALLACLPDGDTEAAISELAEIRSDDDTPALRLVLWTATGDRKQLAAAKRLLDEFLAKNPPEYHESMCTNVRVNREILAAWREEFAEEGDAPQGAAPGESPTRAG